MALTKAKVIGAHGEGNGHEQPWSLVVVLVAAAMALSARPVKAQECAQDNWRDEWIFCHDFEVPDADQFDRYWHDIYGAGERMWLIQENPPGIQGRQSLRLAIHNPGDRPLPEGVIAGPKRFLGQRVSWETIYYRRYMRFGDDFDQGNFMHLGGLIATHPRLYPWGCMGGAGKRPQGDACFSSRLEPWSDYQRLPRPGKWVFYSYYYRMYMNCGYPGPDDCYGDMFVPQEDALISRGKWHVVEMSLDPGTPGQADGSQSFWIDGRPIYTASGIAWRTVPELRVNIIGLELYIHNSPPRRTNALDVDNVVVSRAYIGPTECQDGAAIGAPCRCGGRPDPQSAAHVYHHGYCCSGVWQAAPCRPPSTATPTSEPGATPPSPTAVASVCRLWLPWLVRH